MNGPLWSFLLDIPSIRRAVQHETHQAVEWSFRTAQAGLAKDRERYLRRLNELRGRVAELEAARTPVTGSPVRPAAVRGTCAERAGAVTSDVFCCAGCGSVWLLSSGPDGARTLRKPIGPGCAACADLPFRRPPVAGTSGYESAIEREMARLVSQAVGSSVDLPVPGERDARTDVGVRLAAALAGPDGAAEAGRIARARPDAPPDGCPGLDAVAAGLDRAADEAGAGIAWCATEILGTPEFYAAVLGRVGLTAGSFAAVARGIRVADTVRCAADDELGRCANARHLAMKDATELAKALAGAAAEQVAGPRR